MVYSWPHVTPPSIGSLDVLAWDISVYVFGALWFPQSNLEHCSRFGFVGWLVSDSGPAISTALLYVETRTRRCALCLVPLGTVGCGRGNTGVD